MRSLRLVLSTNLREAVRALRGSRLRTMLGLIGIMLGIASVITMISTAEIAKSQSRKQFEALGTDILTVVKADDVGTSGQGERTLIALADVLGLADALPNISAAAPQIESQGSILYAGKPIGRGITQGVSEAFASINRLRVAEGRFVSDLDTGRYFAVAGREVAAAMRRLGARKVVGETLEIDGRLFTVVGVLADAPESYALPFEVRANKAAFIPITTARRIDPSREIRLIIARAAAGVHHAAAVEDVEAYFAERNPGLSLLVVSAEQLISQMESQLGLMTLLLGAVGSISLIVGGVGVMNIMLISVSERRREIGIRRAVGAPRRDIQSQFLTEAVVLTLVGGLFGIVLGTAATYGICWFTGWEFFLSPTAVVAGVAVASGTGIFFGYQPAYQASRLDPIVALQGE